MQREALRFDDASRCSLSDQPVPPGGVLRAIRESAESAGIDPVSELYNESLIYANEGHLRLARERLHVLLAMAPDDAEARLLLAKVLVGGQRWKEALTALDEARDVGARVPPELRQAVEEHLGAEVAPEEEQANRSVREQGEIKALRSEARRLRVENAQLVGQNYDLEREARRWAWMAAGVSGVVMLYMVTNLLFGGPTEPGPEALTLTTEATAPTEAAPVVSSSVTSVRSNVEVAAQAAERLSQAPGLDGARLEVEVAGGSATLTGTALTFKQASEASALLQEIAGIDTVDTSRITIQARLSGAKHVVQGGDTLWRIARQYYGDANLSNRILDANKDALGGRTDLSVGQELVIPPAQ